MKKISKNAIIGKNVIIGDFTKIYDNVVIGDNSIIEDVCVIGYPTNLATQKELIIGEGALIRSHSVLYKGSTIGNHLQTGHHILVRENSDIGQGVRIGSYTQIEGDCNIGDYVRLHSQVHVAKGTIIGSFVWVYPGVIFTHDPLPPSTIEEGVVVEDMAVICTNSVLLPGVHLGKGSFVAAGSVVNSSVPDVHCVAGNPARVFATLDKLINPEYNIRYPWPNHFRRGYPQEAIPKMLNIAKELEDCMKKLKKSELRKGNT